MISLLYPDNHLIEKDKKQNIVSIEQLKDIDADFIFQYFDEQSDSCSTSIKEEIISFITDDVSVIKYRNEIFEDIFNNPSLEEFICSCFKTLKDTKKLIQYREKEYRTDFDTLGKIINLHEMDNIINLIWDFYNILCKSDIKSVGLINYKNYLKGFINDNEFKDLKEKTAEFIEKVNIPKSVTIGINLDAALTPLEAGVISFNDEYYKSSNLVDKFLRGEIFKKDDYNSVAPLAKFGYSVDSDEFNTLNGSIMAALNGALKSNLFNIRKYTDRYDKKLLTVFPIIDELVFYVGAIKISNDVKKMGYKLSSPVICNKEERKLDLHNFYNIALAINSLINKDCGSAVLNDYSDNKMSIITGVNNGGKTVFLKGLALCQFIFQLGMFIPAEKAIMSPADKILIYISSLKYQVISAGTFETECQLLSEIVKNATKNSFVVMNEPLISTNWNTASDILNDIIKAFSYIGTRCAIVTHFTNLLTDIEEFNKRIDNEKLKCSQIKLLFTQIDGRSGECKYKICDQKIIKSDHIDRMRSQYGLTWTSLERNIIY